MATRRILSIWCIAQMLAQAGGLDLGAPLLHKQGFAVAGCNRRVLPLSAFAVAHGAVLLGVREGRISEWPIRKASSCPSKMLRARGPRMSSNGKSDGSESAGRLARALDGVLDKLEAKSQKKYDKLCDKTDRLKARAARLSNALLNVKVLHRGTIHPLEYLQVFAVCLL